MIILIDGYNLLRYIFPSVKGSLDKQRMQFIRLLGFYREKKRDTIKEIIVVFDAGPFHHATREIRMGIVIIYSGQKSSADEWLLNYVAAHKNYEKVLVSLDRALIASCKLSNTQCMDVEQFYYSVQDVLLKDVAQHTAPDQFDFKRYEQDDFEIDGKLLEIDQEALDIMMQNASFTVTKKEAGEVSVGQKQKGIAHKSSKKNKQLNRMFDKIK